MTGNPDRKGEEGGIGGGREGLSLIFFFSQSLSSKKVLYDAESPARPVQMRHVEIAPEMLNNSARNLSYIAA